jgi:hypothetical protein
MAVKSFLVPVYNGILLNKLILVRLFCIHCFPSIPVMILSHFRAFTSENAWPEHGKIIAAQAEHAPNPGDGLNLHFTSRARAGAYAPGNSLSAACCLNEVGPDSIAYW